MVLATSLSVQARTTLGLAPTAYNLGSDQQAAFSKLQGLLAESIGQPVALRTLTSETELNDWLLRFRQVDAAFLSPAFYRQQPAGALVSLGDIYLPRDEASPSLLLVVAPGLDPQIRNAWQDAFLKLQSDTEASNALTETDVANVARPGNKQGKEKPAIISTPTPTPAKTLEPIPAVTTQPIASKQTHLESKPSAATSVSEPTPKHATETSAKGMGISELIRLVVEQNQQSKRQGAQFSIKQAEEDKTHAIFEPDFVTTLRLEDNEQRNTVQETVNRLLKPIYNERNWNYSASIEGVVPTGARYNLGYLGLSLVQPLLKNAGTATTRTEIDVAQLETRASFQDYRQERMKTVSDAAFTYWEHYQAQQKIILRQDSVRIAEQMLKDNQERVRTGKMAETEVLEAMVGTASRQSLLSEAEQELLDSTNRLKSVLSIKTLDKNLAIDVNETPVTSPPPSNPETIMQKAFELRPDYLAALERLRQADIKIAYAENQSWPELDLIASYGLNGLDFSRSDSWQQIEDTDYASWAVGIEFRLPLQGGIDTDSDLKKSRLEKSQLLWELKDIEVAMANEIDTVVHKINSAKKRLDYANSIVIMQEQLLAAEIARLQAGKSQSRLVLEKEDNYRIAQEEAIENLVRLQTALVDQALAEGSLLLNNDVELTEREY